MSRRASPPRPGQSRARDRRVLLLGGAVAVTLGVLLGTSILASAAVECLDPWSCVAVIRPREDRSSDVYISEAEPDRNFDTGDGSEFLMVRAGLGQRARTLVKFPLDEIPANSSILRARFEMRAGGSCDGQRVLQVWELQQAFGETTATWSNSANLNRGLTPVVNYTVQPQGIQPTGCGELFNIGPGDQPPQPDGGNAARYLTASVKKYYLGQAPYHGWLIMDRDEANTPGNLPFTQRWRSSSDLNNEVFRPVLNVAFDPNTPEVRNLLADQQRQVNATSTRPVNLSFEVQDRVGAVINAWINATTESGQEVFNRSVWENRTTLMLDFARHTVWTNASLDLPEGRYIINALALDSDGNINFTRNQQFNLTVENEPPFVNQSRNANGDLLPFTSAAQLDEGDSLTVRVNATDPKSGIRSVTLEVERLGEVLANLSLAPGQVDQNQSGDWSLTTQARWAGFLNLTIWVQDRAGNLNRSCDPAALPACLSFRLHVRDVLPPVIDVARVLTPVLGAEGAIQEQGGRVAWEARVTDASPLTVTLDLRPPSGGTQSIPLSRDPLTGLYRYAQNFTELGSYGATLLARDLDGNTAQRAGLGFFLQQATPPAIGDLRPGAGGFAPGRANLSALVSDANLDASTITMEVRVPPAVFLPAEARTVTITETSRRVEAADRFFHGETVEVRVRARDLLGLEAERTWSFVVDARAPTSFLTPEGNFLAGERTAVTGGTVLRLERSDEGSGVVATSVAVVNEDRSLGSGNTTITGSGLARINLSASPVYTGTGNYSVFFSSVDGAGNLEEVQRRRFLVDDSPPRVQVEFEPGLLTARIQEEGAGVREARASYWLAPSGAQGSTLMSPTAEPGVWRGVIPDAERGTRVLYAVEVEDLLGNIGRAGTAANPLSSIVQNHRPLVTITPANNSLVRGTVLVEWTTSDPDGDRVETSLAVRPSTATRVMDLAPLRGAQGSIAWDTTQVGDGLWELVVTARDGFETVRAGAFVQVRNTESNIVGVRAEGGEPGQPVRIEATIYKPVRRAEAVVTLRGQEVARAPLLDDGTPPDRQERDGVFTAQFTPAQPGDHRVDLEVVFEDGGFENREVATVGVQHAFPARIVNDPLFFVLFVVAPIAAVGVFLYRRYGPIRMK